MKRVAPVFGVLVLILLLVLVNRGINKTAHPDNDDEATSSPQQSSPAKPAPPAGAGAKTTPEIPSEVTVGDPSKSKYKISVGWIYDEANQANPQALADALQAVQKLAQVSGPTVSAEIINLDVPPGELSPLAGTVAGPGVAVNGQPVTTTNPGEPGATAAELTGVLQPHLAGK